MDEGDFLGRHALLDQLFLDLVVDGEFLGSAGSSEIGEDDLRALPGLRLSPDIVDPLDHIVDLGIRVVFVFGIIHEAHVDGGLATVHRDNQHVVAVLLGLLRVRPDELGAGLKVFLESRDGRVLRDQDSLGLPALDRRALDPGGIGADRVEHAVDHLHQFGDVHEPSDLGHHPVAAALGAVLGYLIGLAEGVHPHIEVLDVSIGQGLRLQEP